MSGQDFDENPYSTALQDYTREHLFGRSSAFLAWGYRVSEFVNYLRGDSGFQSDCKYLRQALEVPALDLQEDAVDIPLQDGSFMESEWWLNQPAEAQKELAAGIQNILEKYRMPQGMYDWVEAYILYRKSLQWLLLFDVDLPNRVVNDARNFLRTPLTHVEKGFVKIFARTILGIKRRPPDDQMGYAYREILRRLALMKNKRRRYRSFEETKILLGHGKESRELDPGTERPVKKTYAYLAGKTLPGDISGEQEKREIQRLRQIKRRAGKRRELVLGKKIEN